MTRKEFIKICGILGVSLPFQAAFSACNKDDKGSFSEKVIIIGTGAGGLSAGYLLNQHGIEFEILEASATYGGRMKRTTDFADFPIPLGAEWLHTKTSVFQEIVNDDAQTVEVNTVGYDSQVDTEGNWDNGQLTVNELVDSDRKFIDSTWFDFFDEYIVPSVTQKIVYNTIVQSIDYSGEQIMVKTSNGEYTADKVIVSVPLKILQDGDISFTPSLPEDKSAAINSATVWEGFKAFIEFSEKFYHTATSFNITPETDGQKLYYDASYGQDTSQNVLGLFTVGKPALDYISRSGDELRDFILKELDEIYDNKATASYVKHMVQNWNDEPFIKAGYLSDHEDWRKVRTLGESVADKVYFAGGPYTDGEDWVSVHAAAQSARSTVDELVK
ncbi:MAG: FAD-dependent oxidoreductase [Reichenbachiella sp.]|uniref:flavin monoamine oxidase family protein n=1 Tax=Reichenbachiella sp. TaxID=2184521 RepID=UPI003265297A